MSTLREDAQVLFVFGDPRRIQAGGCFETLRGIYPKACLVGCSSGGTIQDNRVLDEHVVATAIAFEHTQIASARERIADVSESFSTGQRLVRQLESRGLRHVLIFAEGLKVNGSDFVDGVTSALPVGVGVSGGFAADGNLFSQTHVWCNGEPEESAAVALGFYGERFEVGVQATGGWGPFGPDRLITRSKKNVLYEFDGRPALELYKKYLGEYAPELPASGLMFPLDLRVGDSQQRVLRALLAIDEKEQSITYAGNVPEGAYARFMMGHVDELVEGSLRAVKGSVEQLHGLTPCFSLVVSCNARRAVLKQRVDEEVEIVREVLCEGTAITGFYSYGEIAPSESGGASMLHNETMVVVSFAER